MQPKLLLLFLLPSLSLSLSLSSGPSPPSNSSSTDFIKTSCSSTLYPSLCTLSLLPYSSSIHLSPTLLARTAANLSLSRLLSLSSHLSSFHPTDGRALSALKDCKDSLNAAKDQIRRSTEEIGKLEEAAAAVGPEVHAWRVSNAQTWMSAALTDEVTCEDGFEGVVGGEGEGGRVKMEVRGGVRRVRRYTSNALALVNRLAAR